MRRDVYHATKTVEALPIEKYKEDIDGTTIDTQGADGVILQVQLGELSVVDADNYLTITMEHGDAANMSDATTVNAASGLVGSAIVVNNNATAGEIAMLAYTGLKRYIRLVVTTTVVPVTGEVDVTLGAVCTMTLNDVQPTGDEGLN